MDPVVILKSGHTRANSEKLADWVISSKENLKKFLSIFETGDPVLIQRAAWVIGIAGELDPSAFTKHHNFLLDISKQAVHPAVTRNVLRLFQYADYSDEVSGRLFDYSLKLLIDPQQPSAIRSLALTNAVHVANRFPPLWQELNEVLQNLPEEGLTAALQARMRLHKLRK